MAEAQASKFAPTKHETTSSRRSERELVVTRMFDCLPRFVFEAWTTPELLMRWWAPKSFGITFISCEADVRTGGSYRFVFGHPASEQPMAFFGRYLKVEPPKRIVWTNEESEGGSVSTVTFEEKDGRTLLVLHDLYPSKEALDEALASGSNGAWPEQFEALDELIATSPRSV
jgi:uncharacterized protein YndB with AHSA1/START domain